MKKKGTSQRRQWSKPGRPNELNWGMEKCPTKIDSMAAIRTALRKSLNEGENRLIVGDRSACQPDMKASLMGSVTNDYQSQMSPTPFTPTACFSPADTERPVVLFSVSESMPVKTGWTRNDSEITANTNRRPGTLTRFPPVLLLVKSVDAFHAACTQCILERLHLFDQYQAAQGIG